MNKLNHALARLSPAAAERFLLELANLSDDSIARFEKKYGEMLSKGPLVLDSLKASFEASDRAMKRVSGFDRREHQVLHCRRLIRRFWLEPDLRTREYIVFLLQHENFMSQNRPYSWTRILQEGLPPANPFEQAVTYLRQRSQLTRYCANPDCAAPYFFATRRNQRYCAADCTQFAQREFKRQWWAEHGEEWRASRRAKSASENARKKGKVK